MRVEPLGVGFRMIVSCMRRAMRSALIVCWR